MQNPVLERDTIERTTIEIPVMPLHDSIAEKLQMNPGLSFLPSAGVSGESRVDDARPPSSHCPWRYDCRAGVVTVFWYVDDVPLQKQDGLIAFYGYNLVHAATSPLCGCLVWCSMHVIIRCLAWSFELAAGPKADATTTPPSLSEKLSGQRRSSHRCPEGAPCVWRATDPSLFTHLDFRHGARTFTLPLLLSVGRRTALAWCCKCRHLEKKLSRTTIVHVSFQGSRQHQGGFVQTRCFSTLRSQKVRTSTTESCQLRYLRWTYSKVSERHSYGYGSFGISDNISTQTYLPETGQRDQRLTSQSVVHERRTSRMEVHSCGCMETWQVDTGRYRADVQCYAAGKELQAHDRTRSSLDPSIPIYKLQDLGVVDTGQSSASKAGDGELYRSLSGTSRSTLRSWMLRS